MEPLASYPVFQADQVLTNGHLNNLLNYLEQQGRLSRMKLIGNGIACGLEISAEADRILIGKGVGLTTQGYLISQCDEEYTHYAPYSFPDLPEDLYLLESCGEGERPGLSLYQNKEVFQLTHAGTELSGKKALAGFDRSNYVVVLYLEAVQTHLKNCDTNDCNDKGSRIDFAVRPLLIPKKLFPQTKQAGFNSIMLRRYNVPTQDLATAEAVLAAFQRTVDDDTLRQLSANLVNCWDRHAASLGLAGANPIRSLDLVKLRGRFSVANNNLHHIQYFYDFVDDLVKAFIEFRGAVRAVREVCCADEWASPLHLCLGEASKSTTPGNADPHRHSFQPTPILAEGRQEASVLLQRICQMVGAFEPGLIAKRRSVVITPTNLGKEILAYRCLPYYYKHDDVLPYWSFGRFLSGNFRYNMGYHASVEAGFSDAVANPLHYDIERYNAFRVEGHIGMRYVDALREIQRQQQTYNLPIDVLALDAAALDDAIQGREIHCIVQDLESSYAVLIAGMLCKIRDIISYVATLRPKSTRQPSVGTNDTKKAKESLSLSQSLLTLQAAQGKRVTTAKEMVSVQQQQKKKQAAQEKTGLAYLDKMFDLKATAVQDHEPSLFEIISLGFKDNVMEASRLNLDQFKIYLPRPEYLVNFLNDLDAILKYLIDSSLADFDEEVYNALSDKYAANVRLITKEIAETGEENVEMKEYFSTTNYSTVLFRCTNEELLALKMEYEKRLVRYETAVNFNRYYQQHPGLEHKAGVPKGGTFVLVYQSQPVASPPNRKPLLALVEDQYRKAATAVAEVESAKDGSVELLKAAKALTSSSGDMRAATMQAKSVSEADEIRSLRDTLRKMGLEERSYAQIDKTLEAKEKELAAKRSALPYDVVIADFYLPYRVNSACPPLAYVFPNPAPPVPDKPDKPVEPEQPVDPDKPDVPVEPEKEPSITLNETRFCESDKSAVKVRVEPAGGKLTIAGKAVDKLEFVPSVLGTGTHKVEYTVGTRVASVTVTVAALSDATFGVSDAVFKGETWSVTFAPNSPSQGAKYRWLLKGEDVSAEEKATVSFDLPTYLGADYLAVPKGRLVATRVLTQAQKPVSTDLSLVISSEPCPDEKSGLKITIVAAGRPIARDQGVQEVPLEIGAEKVKFVLLPKGVKFTGKTLVIDPAILFGNATTRTIKKGDQVVAGYAHTTDELVLLVLVLQPAG